MVAEVFEVPVTVRNGGCEFAQTADGEVVLTDGGREVDSGSVTRSFVPARSSVEAVVVVAEDQRRFRAEGRVLGYEAP